LQLLIAPFGARLNRRDKKDLEWGVREDNCAHVTPIGNQAWGLTESALAFQQCFANFRIYGYARGEIAYVFLPNTQGHVLPLQEDGVTSEAHVQFPCDLGNRLNVFGIGAVLKYTQGRQAVEGTAIQRCPTQMLSDPAGDRTLAGGRRAIDSNYGNAALGIFTTFHVAPGWSRRRNIPGKSCQRRQGPEW